MTPPFLKHGLLTLAPLLLAFLMLLLTYEMLIYNISRKNPELYPYIGELLMEIPNSPCLIESCNLLNEKYPSLVIVQEDSLLYYDLYDSSFHVVEHHQFEKNILPSSIFGGDVDEDGLDEMMYLRAFPASAQIREADVYYDSLTVCLHKKAYPDVAFDRIPIKSEVRYLHAAWLMSDSGNSKFNPYNHFLLILSGWRNEEEFHHLYIYRKGSPPVRTGSFDSPIEPSYGIWNFDADGDMSFTFGGYSLTASKITPNAQFIQIEKNGTVRWISELAFPGETYVFADLGQKTDLLGLSQTFAPTPDDSSLLKIFKIDLQTGNTGNPILISQGVFSPFRGLSTTQNDYIGVIHTDGKNNFILNGKCEIKQNRNYNNPSAWHPILPLTVKHLIYLDYIREKTIDVRNLDGKSLARLQGVLFGKPFYLQTGSTVGIFIPLLTDRGVSIFSIMTNPDSWWWVRRNSLFIFSGLLAIFIGIMSYIFSRKEPGGVREPVEEILVEMGQPTQPSDFKEEASLLEKKDTEMKEDIPLLHQLQVKVKSLETYLHFVANHLPDGMINVDETLKITNANAAFGTMLGLDLNKIIGFHIRELYSGLMNSIAKHAERVFLEQKNLEGEIIEIKTPQIERKILRLSVFLTGLSPFVGGDAYAAGKKEVLVLLQDITRLFRFQQIVASQLPSPILVGRSPAIQSINQAILDLKTSVAPVLIIGERGTGKEVVAKAIYHGSLRAEGLFVKVNCVALPEELLASELFGHIKGAFPGASRDKQGLFYTTRGGTLFLDGIDSLSMNIQQSLLAYFKNGVITRIGDLKPIRSDVRIIATAESSLDPLVEPHKFLPELYDLLRKRKINIPPLRERKEDIPFLLEYLRNHFNDEMKRDIKGYSREAIDVILNYKWEGNIRELKNCVERAFILCTGNEVQARHLIAIAQPVKTEEPLQAPVGIRAERIVTSPKPKEAITRLRMEKKLKQTSLQEKKMTTDRQSREALVKSLEKHGWNVSHAADSLGISRQYLHRKMKEFDIHRP